MGRKEYIESVILDLKDLKDVSSDAASVVDDLVVENEHLKLNLVNAAKTIREYSEAAAAPYFKALNICPKCHQLLVHANTDNTEEGVDIYCEDCGWEQK